MQEIAEIAEKANTLLTADDLKGALISIWGASEAEADSIVEDCVKDGSIPFTIKREDAGKETAQ